jgi:hypothetical protein
MDNRGSHKVLVQCLDALDAVAETTVAQTPLPVLDATTAAIQLVNLVVEQVQAFNNLKVLAQCKPLGKFLRLTTLTHKES